MAKDNERPIYLRPIGPVDDPLVAWLERAVADHLELPVEVMSALAVPDDAFEKARNQLHSTKLLKALLREVPGDALKVVGVVDHDLCIPILTFVFGEAQLGGLAAVVALTRLRQEFYGLPADPEGFRRRLVKEVLHELGHAFGLIHCADEKCVMYLSNSVTQVDRKSDSYCESCDDEVRARIDQERWGHGV